MSHRHCPQNPFRKSSWPSFLLTPPLAMGCVYSSLLPQCSPLILKFLCTTPREAPEQPLLNQRLTKVNLKQNAKDPWPLFLTVQRKSFEPPASTFPGSALSGSPTSGVGLGQVFPPTSPARPGTRKATLPTALLPVPPLLCQPALERFLWTFHVQAYQDSSEQGSMLPLFLGPFLSCPLCMVSLESALLFLWL